MCAVSLIPKGWVDGGGAGAVHYSSESADLPPRLWNITWFSALTLSLLPFSHRSTEPVFLPPSSWYLQHTPDGSACLKNIYPFSLNVTDFLPSTSLSLIWRCFVGSCCHFTQRGSVLVWMSLSLFEFSSTITKKNTHIRKIPRLHWFSAQIFFHLINFQQWFIISSSDPSNNKSNTFCFC